MKIFVIVEKGWEYNDEYHEEHGLAGITKAYRSEEKAQAECFRLNKARRSDDVTDDCDQPITDFYDVLALDVPDDEVEPVQAEASNAANAYQRSRDMMKKVREEKQAAFRLAFEVGCQELFRENPDLECFSFTSYTDYFADGETPRHHVHGDYPDINGVEAGDIEYRSSARKDLQPLLKKVKAFINSYDDEDILDAFDDHVRIIVKRPGKVMTEDYSDHS